jgi:hypothetical protein
MGKETIGSGDGEGDDREWRWGRRR